MSPEEDKSLRQIGKKLDRGKAGSERKPTRQNRHQPKKSFRPFVPIPASVFDDPKMFERDLEDLWRKGKGNIICITQHPKHFKSLN